MKARLSHLLSFLFALSPTSLLAQNHVPRFLPDLDRQIAPVLPTAEDDAFLQVPWRLSIMAARVESARTGKPMFVWEMQGHPLCHT